MYAVCTQYVRSVYDVSLLYFSYLTSLLLPSPSPLSHCRLWLNDSETWGLGHWTHSLMTLTPEVHTLLYIPGLTLYSCLYFRSTLQLLRYAAFLQDFVIMNFQFFRWTLVPYSTMTHWTLPTSTHRLLHSGCGMCVCCLCYLFMVAPLGGFGRVLLL